MKIGATGCVALVSALCLACDTPRAPAPVDAGAAPQKASATGTASAAAPAGFDESLLAGAPPRTIVGQVLGASRVGAPNVVAWVKPSGDAKLKPPDEPVVVDQRDKAFLPHVLPLVVGTKVLFRNSDPVLHNVYSRSKPKVFDLGAFSGSDTKTVVFDAPGQVDLFCAIHTNMHSTILVLETPLFATTSDRGVFRIGSVPPGKHRLEIWDEAMGTEHADVEVFEDRATIVKHELGKRGGAP